MQTEADSKIAIGQQWRENSSGLLYEVSDYTDHKILEVITLHNIRDGGHRVETGGSIKTRFTLMSRPVINNTLYLHSVNGGIYKVVYHAPAGARREGIPHDDLTDLLTLEKAGGDEHAPKVFFTSLFDFKEKCRVFDPLQTDTPEQGPAVPKDTI